MVFRNFEDINTAWNQSEQRRYRGDFVGAYDSYLRILSTLIEQGLPQWSHSAVAKIIQATADLSLLMGDFETADNLLVDLAHWYRSTANYPFADFTLLKRIHLELDRGNLDLVNQLLTSLAPQIGNIENIDLSPAGLIEWETSCLWQNADANDRSILFAHLYWAMGRLLAALGQYHDALVSLERGLWHTRADTPSLARNIALSFHFSIASAYLEQGELDTALARLAALHTAFDPNIQPELQVRWLELMGKISLLRGELGQALAQFHQIQEICRRLRLTRAVLQSTINLANILIFINQTSLAKDYLLAALSEQLAQQDPELKQRIDLFLQLAQARSQSLVSDIAGGSSVSEMRAPTINRSDDPVNLPVVEPDFTFSFRSANYLALFEFRVLQFYWLLSRFELDLANQLLTGIQSAFEFKLEPRQGSDSQLIQVKIKILLGTLAYYQGVEFNERDRLIWAASILDEVRPILVQMQLKPELWQVQRILGWCWSRLEKSNLLAEIIDSTNSLLNELTSSLVPEDRAIYLLNKWTADEEYIANELNYIHRIQIAAPSLFKPWRKLQSMHRLHQLLINIDRYKDALAKRTLQDRNQSPNKLSKYSLWERIFTHPRDRVTLTFLVLPDRILVVRIGWLLFDYQIISTTRLELRNLVQGWHQKIEHGNRDLRDLVSSTLDNIGQENQKISDRIGKILRFDSLLAKLPTRIKSITIVPDDILHGFPFASILHQDKYLIKKYAISIAYESRSINRAKISSMVDKSLLVGVSHGKIPLPNVRSEIEQIKSWMKQHQLNPSSLIDTEAKKQTTITQLTQATFFHIACHGIFEHSQPDLSGLVLIPDLAQPPEILSLRELSALDLSKLRHATLSSCWSADHFVLPGRWIISLPETLWRAGTDSILGCLWEVNDIVAVPFMTRFYHYLEQHSRAKALQLTQQDCLAGRLSIPTEFRGDIRNPIYWSGFTLYGNYNKLDRLINTKTNRYF